jgi:hypothetical protein
MTIAPSNSAFAKHLLGSGRLDADNAWDQKKPEATFREMPDVKRAPESPASSEHFGGQQAAIWMR